MSKVKFSNRRWFIVATLFVAIVCNYLDRQLLSILKPEILDYFNIGNFEYAWIVNVFLICYAIMYPISGILVDKFGPKRVLAVGITVWSLACIGGGCCQSNQVWLFTIFRGMLGVSEPTIFASEMVAIALWFRRKERAFPHALCNIGGSVGAIIAPIVIAALMGVLDTWQHVFWLAGFIGLGIGIVWIIVYKDPSEEVLQLTVKRDKESISASSENAFKFKDIFKTKSIWGGILVRIISDPVWYFCCFWLPGFLRSMGDGEGLSNEATLAMIQWIGGLPFLFGAIGAILFCKWSDKLIANGMDSTKARKKVLVVSACFAPVIICVPFVISSGLDFAARVGVVIAVFSVIAAVANGWLFIAPLTVVEQFPIKNAASVLGLCCGAGALGTVVFNQFVGSIPEEGWAVLFIIMGFLHLISAFIICKLVHKETPPSLSGNK